MPPKTLAAVFDGGPTVATGGLGDVASAHGVQGVFFVEGHKVASSATILGRLKGLGHLVANGTYTGAALNTVADPATEIRKTDELIAPYVSGDIYLLRAPQGIFDEALAKRLSAAGLGRYVGPIAADLGATGPVVMSRACWQAGTSAEACAQTYLDGIRAKNHGIVAFDGEDERTGALLRGLLPKLKDEGFQWVRLDQVAPIRLALEAAGAKPGTVGGPGGCQEYGR